MKKNRILANFICLVVIFGILFIGCGKKSDTTDVTKKDNTTQMNNTNNNTQKKDSVVTPKDTLADKMKTMPDTVIMETSMGTMTIALYSKDAPQHVLNFKKLVYNKYYDGLLFHRVIPDFMIQGGDPNTKTDKKETYGTGGPNYTIPAEIKLKHEIGSLAAARTDNPAKASSGSQFYIVTGKQAFTLDGAYTVYGKIIKGIEVAQKIQNVKRDERDCPVDKVVIKKVYFAK